MRIVARLYAQPRIHDREIKKRPSMAALFNYFAFIHDREIKKRPSMAALFKRTF
jgi:hypothetical protein